MRIAQKMKEPHFVRNVGWVILLCLLCIPLAMEAQTKDKRISYTCSNEPLSTVLSNVERLSGYYKMNFSSDELKRFKVTIKIDQKTVPDAVDMLIKEFPLSKSIKGRYIQIFQVKETASQPVRVGTVKGTVIDMQGEPLIGAAVRVKGTNKGTVTDMNGDFSIPNISSNDVLQISYLGKKDIEQKVVFKPFKVYLEDDANMMEDVVVTGYQTISKERSAGSYNIIKGDDIALKAINTNSVIDGLEGLTTGLNINHAAGADKYIIRGTTSLNSTRSPLFVVDGVPLDESLVEDMINSNDIQSVTVLKDATAASIWGSQAANGVIVISTKRGENNQKVKVSYNGSFTYYGKPDYDYYNLMDSKTFMKNAQEMFDEYSDVYTYDMVQSSAGYGADHNLCYNGYTPVVWPHEVAMYEYKNGLITKEQRDAQLNRLIAMDGRGQYEDYFMSNRMFTQHNVSLRGGSNKHTYFLSLSYKGDQGISKDWSDKVTVNAYQDFKVTDWLKWDITVNANFGSKRAKLSPWYSTETLEDMASKMNLSSGAKYYNLPYNIFRDENGWVDQSDMVMAPSMRQYAEDLTGIDMSFYPVEDFNNSTNKTVNTNLRVNTGVSLDLFKGLRYEGRFQYSRIHSRRETFRPSDTYIVREERVETFDTSTGELRVPKTGGHYTLLNALTTDWTLRNQLAYDASFDDEKHQITALLGTELRSYCNTGYTNQLRGYNMQTMQKEDYDVYAAQDWLMPVPIGWYAVISTGEYSQSETAKKYFSLYTNAAYTYDRKYTLNFSLRMDQSNLFGSDPSNQYKPIWSLGAAWKMTEENFMKDISFLNDLTLRLSYGLAGNSPQPGTGGKYDILESYSDSRFEKPGFNIITPANDMLTWEKTRTVNVGFDTRLFNNRVSLTFDYYNKYTTDLIGVVNLNPTTGWLSTTGNLGEMSNRGIELSLNTHNIQSRDFNWFTTLTLSYNKNKVEKLDVESPIELATDLMYQSFVEGYPMGSMFSYRYAGLDSEGRPQAYDKDGNIVTGTDTQLLTKDDVVYSGSTIPKVYGGLTNTLSYKDWELSFMFVYNFGAKMRKDGLVFNGRPGANLLKDYDNRWRKPGDEAFTDIPRYTPSYDYSSYSSVYYDADTRVLDASYIRLRDLTLSYSVPASFCRKLKTESIRITGQVGNLFLIAFNGEGIDPEAYAYSSGMYNVRQEKYGPSFSFGLNVNF